MITFARRFLVLSALLFWQGGFVFYAAVVVPIGQEVLTSGTTQGFITRRVSNWLNFAGAVALAPLLADALARGCRSRWPFRLRLVVWGGLAITLVLLIWLHPRVDAFLDAETHTIDDFKGFRPLHRWYLWISTVQWALGVVYVALMVWAWRDEDRARA
jgi:hypothetical protein